MASLHTKHEPKVVSLALVPQNRWKALSLCAGPLFENNVAAAALYF